MPAKKKKNSWYSGSGSCIASGTGTATGTATGIPEVAMAATLCQRTASITSCAATSSRDRLPADSPPIRVPTELSHAQPHWTAKRISMRRAAIAGPTRQPDQPRVHAATRQDLQNLPLWKDLQDLWGKFLAEGPRGKLWSARKHEALQTRSWCDTGTVWTQLAHSMATRKLVASWARELVDIVHEPTTAEFELQMRACEASRLKELASMDTATGVIARLKLSIGGHVSYSGS